MDVVNQSKKHRQALEEQRKHFENEIVRLEEAVQSMREEGETDLRTVLHLIRTVDTRGR